MRFKTYPRLGLDIEWSHLISGLFSMVDSQSRSQFEKEIAAYWPTSRSPHVTLSVRTSFDLLLQALAFPPGTEVLMSGVNIRHMLEIVEFHHLLPVPVDLDLDTLAPNLDHFHRLISPRTRLCLIAHLFGSIIPLDPYINLCQQHGIMLVEDCAQAFAGSYYLGEERADVSLFSFGAIKTCTALGGAVTLIRDRPLSTTIKHIHNSYPIKSNSNYRKRLLKYCGIKFISYPWIYHQIFNLLRLFRQDIDQSIGAIARGFSPGELIPQLRQKPSTLLLKLLAYRLATCSSYQPRIEIAKRLLTQLKPIISWPGSHAYQHSFWLVPIQSNSPKLLMDQLRHQGFDATQGNTSLIAIPQPNGEPLPNANQLMKQLLYLPVSGFLPTIEYQRLIESITGHIVGD